MYRNHGAEKSDGATVIITDYVQAESVWGGHNGVVLAVLARAQTW
jgi:hypothetical protein